MRGRNSSADLGPGLRKQPHQGLLPIQQFWPKAINPGGLEAEPPVSKEVLLPIVGYAAALPIGKRGVPRRRGACGGR